ncbi:biotin--[acetyl-CoA-carboxylase] ligase [Ekhidna sp.]|uniref:biotin--[acetyl-CoA-carboxylase] ligase n=2 Tax=Ekhidna sp. TaxID=2608089 RepID=UPI0032974A3B
MVFLPQCHSTNDELMLLAKNSAVPEGMVVFTDNQTKGKGQRGNDWISDPGKNVLMSVLLLPKFIAPASQFNLNLISGLAIVETLRRETSKKILLKWPNDVYLNEKKIAGILIESIVRGSKIEASIIGVGLNVNQHEFSVPNATSLFIEEGVNFDKLEIMESFLCNMEKWYLKLKNGANDEILAAYHNLLMWRGEKRIFRSSKGEFEGEIIGINNQGQLEISSVNGPMTFNIKEVEFIR